SLRASCRSRWPRCGLSSTRLYLADAAVSSAAQHGAGRRAGVRSILDDDGAVDNDGRARAAWVAMRHGVRCLVPEIIRIKYCHVGTVAFDQSAAITHFEGLRRATRHLVNRLFERNQPLVPDVAPNNSRKRTVKARMRQALADNPIGCDAIAVGTNECRRRAHNCADIVFG